MIKADFSPLFPRSTNARTTGQQGRIRTLQIQTSVETSAWCIKKIEHFNVVRQISYSIVSYDRHNLVSAGCTSRSINRFYMHFMLNWSNIVSRKKEAVKFARCTRLYWTPPEDKGYSKTEPWIDFMGFLCVLIYQQFTYHPLGTTLHTNTYSHGRTKSGLQCFYCLLHYKKFVGWLCFILPLSVVILAMLLNFLVL